MKTYRFAFILFLSALFIGAITTVTDQSTALAQDNLLSNPSFEGGYSSYIPQTPEQQAACPVGECTTAQMPAGWFPWWVPQTSDNEPWENRMPEYKPVCPFEPCPYPERLKDGAQALQYFTFHSTHTAGLWQRVSVPANANLKFFVWGQAWSSATDKTFSDFPTPVNMRIGIDPTGGTNPFSGTIVWSGFANPYDAYVPFEIEATAQGETVTVFMWSQPQEARKHNDIYWDGASLVVTGQGAPAPAAPAPSSGGTSGGGQAAAPAPVFQLGPTPTPNAEGIIQVTVQPGDSLWAIAARAGLTLDEVLEFNGLTRNSFINAGDTLIIGYGDAGAPVEESTEAVAEGGAPAEGEGETESAEAPAEDAETEAVEEAPAEEAAPEPTAVPEVTTGEICLLAFDDANGDGFFEGNEALKSDVAITIANGQTVVSNYITNGAEPFCIDGLEVGSYRVSRSVAPGEVVTNAADWGVTLAAGTTLDIAFGSQIEAVSPAAEAVAEASTGTEAMAEDTADTQPAMEEEAAQTPDSGGNNLLGWIVGIILGVAVLLFLGIGFVVMSARRNAS